MPPYLVVDIGGGSTEFVLGADGAGDVGAQRRHRLRPDDRTAPACRPAVTGAQIAAATADIDAAIAGARRWSTPVRPAPWSAWPDRSRPWPGIALELPGYDPDRLHHARISAAEVHEVTARLLSRTRAERARIPVMHPGRIDVIGAGALILDRIMSRFGLPDVLVSEHDILDGIAWSLAAPQTAAGR